MWLEVPGSKPSEQNWLYNLWGFIRNESVGLLLKDIKNFRTEQQNINTSAGPSLCRVLCYYTGPISMKLALSLTYILNPHLPSSRSPVIHLCGLAL